MQGKKILLGITGSIAAYKSISLLRLLVKQGAEVKVILTPSAKDFVSPLVLSTLSNSEVLQDLSDDNTWANHVMLGRWADVMLIAPLSCNTLAKMANGICDNLLMATYLSATCPVIAAPAMDEDMWNHPTTKRNLDYIADAGNKIMSVNTGELASGLVGPGRMAEPEEIFQYLEDHFFDKSLAGKHAIVTAGPTYEPIDPVRFIGNYSSGKMGIAIANSLYKKGAEVTLILGHSVLKPVNGVKVISAKTAREMHEVTMQLFPSANIAVMAAAVADYRPEVIAEKKIKKDEETVEIRMIKNPDIIKSCGEIKKDKQLLVGFALETDNVEENARKKLKEKKADIIILNSAIEYGSGFQTDTNKISIFDKDETVHQYELMSKEKVAENIVNYIIDKMK